MTKFTYNAQGSLVDKTSSYGILNEHTTYAPLSNGFTVGRSATSYGYDTRGNLQYVTNTSLGAASGDANYTTEYEYDNLGRVTKQTLPDPDGAGPLTRPTTQNAYDANGNLATATDPRGYVTTYQYDEADRKTQQILPDPDGSGPLGTLTTRYFYDNDGNLRYVVDPRGTDAKEAAYTTQYDYDNLGRKITAIAPDPDGTGPLSRPTTQYVYDANGNLEHTVDPLGHTTWYQYDKLGRQTAVTDALGSGPGDPAHTTTTVYDAVGNALLVTDALGRTTATQYDAMNRPVLVQGPRSDSSSSGTAPTTAYQYDADGQLVATTDPLGHTTRYQYDALHRQIGVTDTSGWRSGDPQHTTVTQYDGLGNVVAVTDPLGQVTSYEFDNLGRKTAVLQPDAGTGRPTTYYGYDASGNLKYVTDPRGSQAGDATYTTWYFYDGLNRQVCTIDPLGAGWALSGIPDAAPSYSAGDHSVRTTYDAVGNVVEVADALGQATDYGYDNLGRKTSWTQPDPDGGGPLARPQTTYAYDADGNLSSTTDPLGHVTRYGYDALNRRTQVTDALGSSLGDPDHTTTTVYDAVGNVLSVQDPEQNTTSYAYDRLNRVVAQTDPLGQNTTYAYDAAGRLTQKTDRDGRVTEYSYDGLGRQVEERWRPDANSAVFHTIHTYYDANGQVRGIEETDTVSAAAGTLYQYSYDADGRVTNSRMAPGDLAQSASPAVNNGQLGDGLNGEQDLDWDSDGVSERADTWTFSLAAGIPVLLNLSSTAFDATLIVQRPGGYSSTWLVDSDSGGGTNASLWFTPDATGTWTVAVTSPDRATGAYTLEETANADPIVSTALVEFDYTYDKAGNMLTAAESQFGSAAGLGATTTDAYDALDRLTQTKQAVGGTVNKRADFAWRDDGSRNTVTRYSDDGITQIGASSHGYDGIGRLTALTHLHDQTALATYGWEYDAAGRITGMTTDDDSSDFGYDATDQLTAADHEYQADEGYQYDNNGNRTNTGYSTGTGNRLASDGTYHYTYDGEGNRTFRFTSTDGVLNAGDTDITAYAWDHRNRLTSVSDYTTYANYQAGTRDSVVQYTYDYLDRRIGRTIDADGSGAGTPDSYYNVYQGDNPALEVHDSNGLAAGGTGENAPHRQHRWLYGQAVDEVLASEDTAAAGNATGAVLWGLGDHEGTIRDIMDSSGTVVDHRKFDSFGKMTSESAPATDFVFGYTGQALDEATGLYDYWHRWYDPSVGRFASEDPSGFAAGDANLYRYVGNNAINNTDPSGLQAWGGTAAGLLDSSRPAAASTPSPLVMPFWGGIGLNSNVSDAALSDFTAYWLFAGLQAPAPVPPPSVSLAAEPQQSLRTRAFTAIDRWAAHPIYTGWQAVDATAAFFASFTGNAIAKPAMWIGTSWREDTEVDRINAIIARQKAIYQADQVSTLGAVRNLYAGATTDQIAFGGVGYDPIQERALQGSERIQRVAGGTAGYASTFIPVAKGAAAVPAGTLNPVVFGSARTSTVVPLNVAGVQSTTRQTFATGSERYDYFAGKYGAQNVDWVSGSGRTVTWPSELPMPAATQMFKVPPPPRSGTFVSDLESVAGPRPADAFGHHVQPLGLQGLDNGLVNGAWVSRTSSQSGHGLLNRTLNRVPYGTEIRIKPPR